MDDFDIVNNSKAKSSVWDHFGLNKCIKKRHFVLSSDPSTCSRMWGVNKTTNKEAIVKEFIKIQRRKYNSTDHKISR